MRRLLLLALILYDIICNASRPNSYDYEADGIKRHSPYTDDRRNWRKKALLKSMEHENPKYPDANEAKLFGVVERQRNEDIPVSYSGRRANGHYEEDKGMSRMRSAEMAHVGFMDKEDDKKNHFAMNCGRQHERYEPCFAGCAAVTCDNPRERLRPCYPFCEAGCICIHPYVRDDRTHKCILPEECTKGLKGIPDLGDDT